MLNFAPSASRLRIAAATFSGIVGNFRQQDHVGAAGDAGLQRDPTGVAPHHFDDHDALVRFRGGVQAIDRVGRERHRGVESEAAGRPDNVVVDRLRHADDGDALQVELVRDAQRAVAADHHERLQSHLVKGLDDPIRVVDLALGVSTGYSNGIAVIGGAENGPAEAKNAGDVLRRQDARASRVEQAVEAVFETDDLDPGVESGLHDGANNGVEAGCITAAGEHANTFDRRHVVIDYNGKSRLFNSGRKFDTVNKLLTYRAASSAGRAQRSQR